MKMKNNRLILMYMTLFTTFIFAKNDCPIFYPMPAMDGLVVVMPVGTKSVDDIDCDGIVDSKDRDVDGDGIPDKDSQSKPNGWDAYSKGDSTLDNGPDDNHDGWNDIKANEDADGDGYTNQEEVKNGTNPYDPNSPKEPFIFALNTEETGNELWVTDGEESNTHLLKDIKSTTKSSEPSNIVRIKDITYFTADDGVHGRELWKSDGTEAGTVMVKDIISGEDSAYPYDLTSLNGTLYFMVTDGHIDEFWKSDGTEAGTVMDKDINR